MRAIVLGSGLLGVSSAWYLSQLGHEVTVIDRQAVNAHWRARATTSGKSSSWAATAAPCCSNCAARRLCGACSSCFRARPTTPSNVPLIGQSRVSNLYLNTGYGTLGWTHACGSARCWRTF